MLSTPCPSTGHLQLFRSWIIYSANYISSHGSVVLRISTHSGFQCSSPDHTLWPLIPHDQVMRLSFQHYDHGPQSSSSWYIFKIGHWPQVHPFFSVDMFHLTKSMCIFMFMRFVMITEVYSEWYSQCMHTFSILCPFFFFFQVDPAKSLFRSFTRGLMLCKWSLSIFSIESWLLGLMHAPQTAFC